MSTKDVYSYPEYCEIAYNWDRTPECDFIEECIRRYSSISVNSILDIACGTGIILREFARRGYKALGLDKSREMVEFVNRKATLEGLDLKCVHSDMRSFQLGDKYGCVICMLDSFRYLLTDDDILSHFRSVAKELKVGGLYILDFWMPKDENVIEWEEARWVQQDKDISIDATYRQLAHTFSPKDKIFKDELIFRIRSPKFNSTINGRTKTRLLFLSELKELVRKSELFNYIDRFYNFDFDLKEGYNIKPIRTNIILRRKGED
ncbi:MAG: class I SAM-dependent methyltransferase [Candidatus Omnitrophota bacterium]